MKSTADRYREAGMPPPKGEVFIPLGHHQRSEVILRDAARRVARKAPKRTVNAPLAERVHDPAIDGPVLPEIDPSAYGPDSVPLDIADVDTTEERS